MKTDSSSEFTDNKETELVGLVLPPTELDGTVHMYWLDIHEDPINAPGRVYIFGKVFQPSSKSFVSCGIFVNDIQRTLYVAKRTHEKNDPTSRVDKNMVAQELIEIKKKFNISEIRAKEVHRAYYFDQIDVPQGYSKFLKVSYSYSNPSFDDSVVNGGNTYSHIFGSKTSAVENLIIQKKIMGPCWLSFSGVRLHEPGNQAKKTWCVLEGAIDSPKSMKILPYEKLKTKTTPRLSVLSLKVQVTINHTKQKNEIIAVSGVLHNCVNSDGVTDDPDHVEVFTLVRKLGPGYPFPLSAEVQKYAEQKNVKGIRIEAQERGLNLLSITKPN